MNNVLVMDTLKSNQEDITEAKSNINNLQNDMSNITQTIINLVYPIGAVFITMDNNLNNPTDIFPGTTWEQLPTDRFLFNQSTAGNTGGSFYIGVENLPPHSHNFVIGYTWDWGDSLSVNDERVPVTESVQATTQSEYWGSNALSTNRHYANKTEQTGNGSSYQQPFITVRAWKRIN